jgi:uncharacterized protein
MGMNRSAGIAAALLTATIAGGCAKPPVVDIGDGWMVDEGLPQKPAAHLYREVKGTRVLVDRQIEAYRLYGQSCLMYQTSRPEGHVVYVVWGRLKPLGVVTTDALHRWRMDADGLRRFDTPADPDGRALLSISLMKYGEICYNAQLQPPFKDGEPANPEGFTVAAVPHMRMTPEETVLDVHGADSVGNTVLSDAAREGQISLVDELIAAGADVNASNDAGITVLMSAVSGRHLDVARRLIKGGARVNAQADSGGTALMMAASYRNLEMAQLLVEEGADSTIRDDMGRTAAVWVPDSSSTDMRPLRELLQRPAVAAK